VTPGSAGRTFTQSGTCRRGVDYVTILCAAGPHRRGHPQVAERASDHAAGDRDNQGIRTDDSWLDVQIVKGPLNDDRPDSRTVALRFGRPTQQMSPSPWRRVFGPLLGLASLVGLAVEIYQFEYAFPKVSIVTPGIRAPLSFEIENDSYIDFFSVSLECDFHYMKFSNDFILGAVIKGGFAGMATSAIESGATKLAGCGVVSDTSTAGALLVPDGPIKEGDISVKVEFKYRCLPLFAVCHRQRSYRFRLVDGKWLEGESF
jgi:hypothetical protein